MKQKVIYSKGNGAIFIAVALFCIIFLYEPLISLYHQYGSQFGNTHFIVGYPHNERTENKPQADASPLAHRSFTGRVLFSPDDDVKQQLLNLIEKENKGIKIAIFTFTDKDVAQALLQAHERGVHIEIVADSSYLRDQYSKIAWLQHHKIPVYTYNPHYKAVKNQKTELMSIMHHKFVVFLQNQDKKSLVWTGSFNFTRSANLRNQENVIILEDPMVVDKYTQQFNRLKRRCDNCYEENQAFA